MEQFTNHNFTIKVTTKISEQNKKWEKSKVFFNLFTFYCTKEILSWQLDKQREDNEVRRGKDGLIAMKVTENILGWAGPNPVQLYLG